MDGNKSLEQPHPATSDKNDIAPPLIKPEYLGYKKFVPPEQSDKQSLKSTKEQKEAEEKRDHDQGRVNSELELKGVDPKTALSQQDISSIDSRVKIEKPKTQQEEKASLKANEKNAFNQLISSLNQANKIPIVVGEDVQVFEFSGLNSKGEKIETKEGKKQQEAIDKGSDVLSNMEFQFTIKGEPPVNFRVSLHQIMRDGLHASLESLLIESNAGAAEYSERTNKEQKDKAAQGAESAEAQKQKNEKSQEAEKESATTALHNLLKANQIQSALAESADGKWATLKVTIPEKNQQFSIRHDDAGFHIKKDAQQSDPRAVSEAAEVTKKSPEEVLIHLQSDLS